MSEANETGKPSIPVERIVMPCLFCGSDDVDSQGWAGNSGDTGPQCLQCGATAESVALWNNRVHLVYRLTNAIDEAIRKSRCATYEEWQALVTSVVEA